MVRLQDGSLFQTFADITELKKHELELARLNTATDYSSVGTLIRIKMMCSFILTEARISLA